jgi:hypothetical protein
MLHAGITVSGRTVEVTPGHASACIGGHDVTVIYTEWTLFIIFSIVKEHF